MSVDLTQMISLIGIMISNQLTDEQIRLLINYVEIEELDARTWARQKTEVVFNTFAIYSTGTVNVTQGSSSVVGVGTAFTAAMTGMRFRAGTGAGAGGPSSQFSPIEIAAVPSPTQLTLATPYPNVSANALGFQIFPLFYSLPGMRQCLGVRQQVPLRKRTHEWFNFVDPWRSNYTSPSVMWAPFGRDHNDNAKIELWPVETSANGYTAYAVRDHIDLVSPQDLPLLPPGVLMSKAVNKACATLYLLNGDARWANARDSAFAEYQVELDRALDGDREEYGVIEQVLDARYSDSGSGNFPPGIDQVWNRDWIG